mmetsp:Transcript_30549/g.43328  ORF Transcript_30549/g.43328 Transcript_30549/m.43328 type:complete len:103 (-) Transcript_30549:217-525(-)
MTKKTRLFVRHKKDHLRRKTSSWYNTSSSFSMMSPFDFWKISQSPRRSRRKLQCSDVNIIYEHENENTQHIKPERKSISQRESTTLLLIISKAASITAPMEL